MPGSPPNYQDVFGRALTRFARTNPRVVGITGAMPSGTGLSHLAAGVPHQFFDVGIAEEHAVLFAAGMATKGFRPVCAIYSTFLQRAYDQVIHDVALQNLPVTFCMDRAGLSPNDGPTHHGLFDLSYLRCIPNATIMQPKDEDELVDMLHTSLSLPGPGFIRYPRGAGMGVTIKDQPAALPVGLAEVLREGSTIMIWAGRHGARRAPSPPPRGGGTSRRHALSNADRCSPLLRIPLDDRITLFPGAGYGSAVPEALRHFDRSRRVNCTAGLLASRNGCGLRASGFSETSTAGCFPAGTTPR